MFVPNPMSNDDFGRILLCWGRPSTLAGCMQHAMYRAGKAASVVLQVHAACHVQSWKYASRTR